MTNEKEKTVTVLKYEIWFTKRTKDQVTLHWFSFPLDLLTHPDFEELTAEEWKWFIWMVTVCSKIKNGTIRINIKNAVRVGNLEESAFQSMITKLKDTQVGEGSCPQHKRARAKPDQGQHEASTDRTDITEQNNTDRTEKDLDQGLESSSATAVLFGFLMKNELIAEVLPDVGTETIKSWLKYERGWLRESIENAILHRMEKAKAVKASDLTNWGTTLITWFKNEKNPFYSEAYTLGDGFLQLPELKNQENPEVAHAG